MRKLGILNAKLQEAITELRHGDGMVIVDQGFPIPKGCYTIDLSLVTGIPTFKQVLKAVLDEMRFCEYYIVDFMEEANKEYYDMVTNAFDKYEVKERLSMDEFVEKTKEAKLVIRTGEPLPASNIYLTSCSGDPWSVEEYDVVID
ncbi:D-ribose pyranase [Ruminococcus sp. AF14-10]|nr:D-ribose pyranase [Ruminococcus sp. AF14-10]